MLSINQREIIKEFYSYGPTRVAYDKAERNGLWNSAKKRMKNIDIPRIKQRCPALACQIEKSYQSGANIQSAVFSECSYAQTLANMMRLDDFIDCSKNQGAIESDDIKNILTSQNIVPRYCYANQDKILVQAGGHGGIDCILINKTNYKFYMIEFKEPYAKTSEPDLPKYGEGGKLRITSQFLDKNPQFKRMLNEQKGLNFFDIVGSNINNFSSKSVKIAVSKNYSKTADVVCTEDRDGYLTMMPSDQLARWAELVGEIRPAGRNHHSVWTPKALNNVLASKGATIANGVVTINKNELEKGKERGGGGKVSRCGINSIFFVYSRDCQEKMGQVSFDLSKVQQLNPTVAVKIHFKNLTYDQVKKFYTCWHYRVVSRIAKLRDGVARLCRKNDGAE